MSIRRRHLLAAAGASALAAPALERQALAQAKQINLAGASYDMREAILANSPSAPASRRGPSSIPRPR